VTIKMIRTFIYHLIFLFLIGVTLDSKGQNTVLQENLSVDTLILKDVIQQIVEKYPSVLKAMEALNSADARINLSKNSYYPNVNITASYTRLGPTPEIEIPNMGKFQLYPENNYAAALNYYQNIYDFGKTSSHVEYEKENKKLIEQSIEQVKQKLSMRAVRTYYSLMFLQEAMRIKQQQIHTLEEHRDFIKKKMETGSSTEFEFLTTQVKLSGIETQELDLETSWKTQLSVLNSLLGLPENKIFYVKSDIDAPISLPSEVSLIVFALNNRNEMKIAVEKEKLSQLKLQVSHRDNLPEVHAFASGGGKNGYVPNLDKITPNYVVGIGLSVPIYDASRTKNNIKMAQSAIQDASYETILTQREITNEVIEYYLKEAASIQKVDHFKLQAEQAQKAFNLAETSYKSGVITNVELLDANTSLSESKLLLLNSKIEYILSMYGLKMAVGELLY
jgi:outer membrane protein